MPEKADSNSMSEALKQMLSTLPDHNLNLVCVDMSVANGYKLGANEAGEQTAVGNEIFKLLIKSGYMITYEKVGSQLKFLEKMALHY